MINNQSDGLHNVSDMRCVTKEGRDRGREKVDKERMGEGEGDDGKPYNIEFVCM